VREVEKRLEEIEANGSPGYEPYLNSTDEWLCTRLRDALEVIESRKETIEQALWLYKLRGAEPKWVAAYRRLFGEEESRGR